jgi:hypothetical protein
MIRGKRLTVTGATALAVSAVLAASFITASPALASGGWGFGMDYGPSVVASCDNYNFVAARVDIPPKYEVGYVNGTLRNPRTQTSKRPLFGGNQVPATGAPTLAYVIFAAPAGTVDGDVLQVDLTLSAPGGGVVGRFGFSYRCATGEVIPPPSIEALNGGYGETLVAVARGVDSQGNAAVDVWCADPDGRPSYINLKLTGTALSSIPAMPDVNTLIDKNNSCRVPVAAYVLTSGEYQIMIGPDHTGVMYVMIFSGLDLSNIHFERYNIDQGL